MAYSENNILSRQLQTVAHCQDSYRLSRQLQTVQKVADCQDSCRLSRKLKTGKTVADRQDSCRPSRQLQAVKTVAKYKTGINYKLILKSRIQETLNLSMCADSSTDTQTKRNRTDKIKCHISRVTCHVSHVTCHMSRVACQIL